MKKIKELWEKYKKYFTAFNISLGIIAIAIFFIILFLGVIPSQSLLVWIIFIVGIILAMLLIPAVSKKIINYFKKFFR